MTSSSTPTGPSARGVPSHLSGTGIAGIPREGRNCHDPTEVTWKLLPSAARGGARSGVPRLLVGARGRRRAGYGRDEDGGEAVHERRSRAAAATRSASLEGG